MQRGYVVAYFFPPMVGSCWGPERRAEDHKVDGFVSVF